MKQLVWYLCGEHLLRGKLTAQPHVGVVLRQHGKAECYSVTRMEQGQVWGRRLTFIETEPAATEVATDQIAKLQQFTREDEWRIIQLLMQQFRMSEESAAWALSRALK